MTQLQTPEKRDPAGGGANGSRSRGLRLTSNQIQGLKPQSKLYEITDPACPGLKLRVSPTGSKVWAFRFYWERRRQLLKLGAWPETGLAQARERCLQARKILDDGIDPRKAGIVRSRRPIGPLSHRDTVPHADVHVGASAAKAANKRETDLSDDPSDVPSDPHSVRFLAHEFYHRHIVNERGYIRPEYVKDLLNRDVLPFWAKRDARTIKPREVIELLDRIVDRGSKVMANRVADKLSQMFRYGIHREIVADSPVKLLYKPGGTERTRERALSDEELKVFLLNYKKVCRTRRTAHILIVLLLTLQRRQELALARKSDFDLQAGTWKIPDEHAKGRRGQRRGHIVPLTPWAIDEIRALMELAGDSIYLLPRKNGLRPINPMLITRSVERLQDRFGKIGMQQWTPHDLRRTGRTGLSSLRVSTKIAERVINHKQKRIKRTYDVYKYFKEKQDALNKWANHLAQLVELAKVEQQNKLANMSNAETCSNE